MRSIDTLENQQGSCSDRADAFVWCVLYPFLTIHSTKERERDGQEGKKYWRWERERERETAATWSWSIIQVEQTFLTEKILLIHIHPVIISLSHSRFSFYFLYSVYCWDRKNEKKLHTIYKKRIFGKRGQRALLNVKRIRKKMLFFSSSFKGPRYMCLNGASEFFGYWKKKKHILMYSNFKRPTHRSRRRAEFTIIV